MSNDVSVFLDTRRTADYVGLSHRTLGGYRVTGAGPAFHRFGNRVRYSRRIWTHGRRSAGRPRRQRPTGSKRHDDGLLLMATQ